MPPSGYGGRKILIVAEAPGATEDEQGTQLVGDAGQLLRRALRQVGIDLDEDCWKTNALICRPPKNRTPSPVEIDYCRPNLTAAIKEREPEIIIPLGAAACKAVIEPLWGNPPGGVLRWVGHRIPDTTLNAWICPTWHPSFLLRQQGKEQKDGDPLALWFNRHLAAAAGLQGRPWPAGPPDPRKGIRCLMTAEEAATLLATIPADRGLLSLDYETDRLKPDAADARIICAGVAWGEGPAPKIVAAFPWYGPVIPALGRLLGGRVAKVAHNLQMEDRWTRRFYGRPPRNWAWCTQQGAHILDNREETTGLKFQVYVQFGIPDYSHEMEPYLEGDASATISRSNARNNIAHAPLARLLMYCGIDAMSTYRLARKQAAALGVTLGAA